MKLTNNQTILIIVLSTIIIIASLLFFKYGITPDNNQNSNKDTIISLQEEKIKKLESELAKSESELGNSEIDFENNTKDINIGKSLGDISLDGGKNIESVINKKDALNISDTIKTNDSNSVKNTAIESGAKNTAIENNDVSTDSTDTSDKDLSALFKTAVSYQREGENQKAIKTYIEYLTISDRNIDVYYNLTIAYAENKQFNESQDFAIKSLYVQPDARDGYRNLAAVYLELGDKKKSFICSLINYIKDGEEINKNILTDEQKVIYDLEYEKLKNLIEDKKFYELREYTFSKYLNITEDTFNLEDYIGSNSKDSNTTNVEKNTHSKNVGSKDAPDFVMLRELYNQAVDEATAGNTQESINLYKKYITLVSQLTSGDYASRLSGAWNNLAFSFKTQKNDGAEIVSFMMAKALGSLYDQTVDAHSSQKQIIATEQETIDEYIKNKDYDFLRRYLFNKYMGDTDDEFDIENNG